MTPPEPPIAGRSCVMVEAFACVRTVAMIVVAEVVNLGLIGGAGARTNCTVEHERSTRASRRNGAALGWSGSAGVSPAAVGR
jgi:hypothetical protein